MRRQVVGGQQGRGRGSFDFVWMRGQEMLLEFQGIAAHVCEVAEFAAKVLSVALAIRGLPANSD